MGNGTGMSNSLTSYRAGIGAVDTEAEEEEKDEVDEADEVATSVNKVKAAAAVIVAWSVADTAAAADTLSSKLSTKLYFAKVFFMVLNICFAAFLVFLLAALTRGLPRLGFVVNPVQMSPLRTHRRHAGNDLSHLVRTVLHSSQLNGNFLTSSRARFIGCIGV